MKSNIDKLKKDLGDLIKQGQLLLYSMAKDLDQLDEDSIKTLKEEKLKLPSFRIEYNTWYSEALSLIKQVIPSRLDDFTLLYKNPKRKSIDFETYGISDYLLGLKTTRYGSTQTNESAALPKMQNQLTILISAEKRFESTLFDIKEILQADLFDSELAAAKELAKKGFFRAAGAVSGVVLEKHLGHICNIHNLKVKKKNPTISDFYELLKNNSIIDIEKWRFIQHLGDLRNICDHSKDRDPTKEDALKLIEGVEEVIKTVF